MFKKLTTFKYQRNFKEGIGFYLAYLLLVVIASGFFTVVAVLFIRSDPYELGSLIGIGISSISSCILTFLIIKEKQLFNNFLFLFLVLISGFLAIFGGGLLGLIIPSYLSTRKEK